MVQHWVNHSTETNKHVGMPIGFFSQLPKPVVIEAAIATLERKEPNPTVCGKMWEVILVGGIDLIKTHSFCYISASNVRRPGAWHSYGHSLRFRVCLDFSAGPSLLIHRIPRGCSSRPSIPAMFPQVLLWKHVKTCENMSISTHRHTSPISICKISTWSTLVHLLSSYAETMARASRRLSKRASFGSNDLNP